MHDLGRNEYSYKAERDHLDDATPCACGACGARWRYDQLRPIGDCSLTPGDASPAGRCGDPSCDSLAYPDAAADPGAISEQRLRDAARALLAAYGGNVPDWLRSEAEALQRALGEPESALRQPLSAPSADAVTTGQPPNPFAAVPLADLLDGWEHCDGPDFEEGWGLFESDTYGHEIEADAEADVFGSDDDALAFVRARAAEGSNLHQLAVAIHDAQEAKNKAVAQAAGYSVRAGFSREVAGPVWGFVRPGESEVRYVGPCRSDVAAWSAAWRDLCEQYDPED